MSFKSAILIACAAVSLAFAGRAQAYTSHEHCTDRLSLCFAICNDRSAYCFNECMISYSMCTKYVVSHPRSAR